jgi:putative ABC transport system ATP-binding protein
VTTSPPLVEGSELHKSYRRGTEIVHALAGVDIALEPGELVALVGRSGSGKSTLLNLLAGWEGPDEGTLRWAGRVISGRKPLRWDDLAMIPQSLGLIEELSIRANVELPARLGGSLDSHTERVDQLVGHLGLGDLAERMPDQTSLGEQQRTALARALVAHPLVLLADEPTGHQDATWARRVLSTLAVAAGEGTACLVATHSDEVASFASRVLRMHDGRIERG